MPTQIRIADWIRDNALIKSVRHQVFIEEQKVSEELEWDEQDKTAQHCIATIDHKVVATARLQTDGQLGRMAVLQSYRNKGIGTEVLKFLIKLHQKHSTTPIVIHAQTHAINFYKKFGFAIQGEEYYEAGIPHYTMTLIK